MSVSYEKKEKYSIDDLLRIMEILRSEEGCPWDREQTHPSMRRDMIEEAYEVCEAIDLNDTDLLKEELGDVLFAAVKVGRFVGVDPEVAIHGTCEKFIRRYRAVEEGAAAMGKSVDQLPPETLETLWVEAKRS